MANKRDLKKAIRRSCGSIAGECIFIQDMLQDNANAEQWDSIILDAALLQQEAVNRVTISFMAQKMVLDAADERFEAILDEAEACIKRVDANCRVIRK